MMYYGLTVENPYQSRNDQRPQDSTILLNQLAAYFLLIATYVIEHLQLKLWSVIQ